MQKEVRVCREEVGDFDIRGGKEGGGGENYEKK